MHWYVAGCNWISGLTWRKQGNDLPPPLGRAGLALQVFFPWSENNFKADFSRVKVYDIFTFHLVIAAGKILNFGPRKAGLKIVLRL
jgi:hypothetical protein